MASGVTRELVVLTSNIFSPDLTPTQHKNYDFYQHGGLIRAVCVHTLPASAGDYISRIDVVPTAAADGTPVMLIRVLVGSW